MPRIVVVGEAMLELARVGTCEGWALGYGGDTLNTAIHLARAGHDVAYFTATGIDPFAAALREQWAQEGLDTALVLTDPDHTTGLYAITTDPAGERSFTYWRGQSAARQVFALVDTDPALRVARTADLLVFSLISLAILPDAGREALLQLARDVRRAGGSVAFDGNYRPRLWESAEAARRWRDAAIAAADIGLPTLEDETALSGEIVAEQVAAHWRGLGCGEVIVKLGAAGCLLPGGAMLPPPRVLAPLDTSGAGDAFNSAYLGARLRGAPPEQAAAQGHALGGWVVMRRGAIPARDSAAPYQPPDVEHR